MLALRCAAAASASGLRSAAGASLLPPQRPIITAAVLQGKNVLELGSGPGLAGLGAALFGGARRVILTDCNREVLRLLRHNVALNSATAASVKALDFTSRFEIDELLHEEALDGFDVLLACEVTYDALTIRAFWRAVDQLLGPSGVLIVAREIRSNGLEVAMTEGAATEGFTVEPSLALGDLLPDLQSSREPQTSRPAPSNPLVSTPSRCRTNRPELPTDVDWSRFHINICHRTVETSVGIREFVVEQG